MTTKGVLSTPLEISEEIRRHFPKARVDENEGRQLVVVLSSVIPEIQLDKSVDAEAFRKALKDLIPKALLHERMNPPQNLSPLRLSSFSTLLPLSDWNGFHRAKYESQGGSCAALVITYLNSESPETLSELGKLGLSPADQTNALPGKGIVYFKEVERKIAQMPLNEQQTNAERFQRLYPFLANYLMNAVVREEEERSAKDNDLPGTLERLQKGVLGQGIATRELANVIVAHKQGQGHRVFLFVGPSGVGKTELAKVVSQIKNSPLASFYMNTMISEADHTKLFGSSAGYVGSTDKSALAKEFDKLSPKQKKLTASEEEYTIENGVVLFDEFEKAHPKIRQSLLTLLDEGHVSVDYTKDKSNVKVTYRLSKSIIICTSNLYQQVIMDAFRQNLEGSTIVERFKQAGRLDNSGGGFPPELLGRMSVIPFGPVPRGEAYQGAIKKQMDAFLQQLKQEKCAKETALENEQELLEFLERLLYGDGTNVRKVRRYFDRLYDFALAHMSSWGDPNKRKIILGWDREEGLFLKAETFLPAPWNAYRSIGPMHSIHLPPE